MGNGKRTAKVEGKILFWDALGENGAAMCAVPVRRAKVQTVKVALSVEHQQSVTKQDGKYQFHGPAGRRKPSEGGFENQAVVCLIPLPIPKASGTEMKASAWAFKPGCSVGDNNHHGESEGNRAGLATARVSERQRAGVARRALCGAR